MNFVKQISYELFVSKESIERFYEKVENSEDLYILCHLRMGDMYIMYTYWNNGSLCPEHGHIENVEGLFLYDVQNKKLRAPSNGDFIKFDKTELPFGEDDPNIKNVLKDAINQFINGVTIEEPLFLYGDNKIIIPKNKTESIGRANYMFALINNVEAKMSVLNDGGDIIYYKRDDLELKNLKQDELQLKFDF